MAQHKYDPAKCGYNITGTTMHTLRAKIAAAIAGAADCHIACLTDSTFGGYNGAAYAYDGNPLRAMARGLATRLGAPWQQGVQYAGAQSNLAADNWVLTGGFAVVNSLLFRNGAGTATRNPLPGETGTSVAISYSDLGTNGIAWTIDGVAQTALPTTGTNTIRTVTVNGLSNATHTIVVTTSAGQNITIAGTRIWTPATKGVHIHNMSVGGSRASGTTGSAVANNLNWSSTSTSGAYGLGWLIPNTLSSQGVTPDFIIVSIGGNDISNSATVAATATGIATMFGYYATTPGMLINAHKVSTVADALQNQLSAAKFSSADSLGRGLFNWDDYVGGLAGATADGVIGADATHPTTSLQGEIGRAIASLIAA